MSSSLVADKQFIVSRSEFIRELTSTDDDFLLRKRMEMPEDYQFFQSFEKPNKALIAGRSFSEAHEIAIIIKPLERISLEEVSPISSPRGELLSFTVDSIGSENQKMKKILADQLGCHKALIKHFLQETIINEKFNIARFNILPKNCQRLILYFLRKQFNFDLNSEIKNGSHKKFLYQLKGKEYLSIGDKPTSLSFLTDCYIFGLMKQLGTEGSKINRDQTIKILHDKLFNLKDTNHLTTFNQTIEQILNYEINSKTEILVSVLSQPLLNKMNQISEKTLKKFFSVKLTKSLASAIDESVTYSDLQRRLGSFQNIDLLSAYLGSTQHTSRVYIASVLQLNNINF